MVNSLQILQTEPPVCQLHHGPGHAGRVEQGQNDLDPGPYDAGPGIAANLPKNGGGGEPRAGANSKINLRRDSRPFVLTHERSGIQQLQRPSGGAPEAPLPEDAGTQALSEALRSSFFIIQIIMVGLVLVFFGSGFFTVKEQNKAIILRLGRPVGKGEAALLGPGPHFAWPRPIDEVVLIPFKSSQRADSTVGWYLSAEDRAKGAPDPQPEPSLDPATISYALTADTNIIHLAASARYRITDPIKFHFDFDDAAMFVTNDLNNALLYTASHFTVDDVLTAQPTAFKEAVEARMRELVEKQDLGITVDGVDPQTSPPLTLLNDFHRVVQASAEGANQINQAEIRAARCWATPGAKRKSASRRPRPPARAGSA